MKLDTPFYQLPLVFDVDRLLVEARSFQDFEWRPDRLGVRGYRSLNLVAHRGGINDERQYAPMEATALLERAPYLRQVIAAFESPCAEVRLRWLEAQASVPPHFDTDYQWFRRFRLHVPIVSAPEISFMCGGHEVHMAPGEAWVFDRWITHEVKNVSAGDRIHLIIDTVGSGALFDLIESARKPLLEATTEFRPIPVPYARQPDVQISFETTAPSPILSPGDVDDYVHDLSMRLEGLPESRAARNCLRRFALEWRGLWVQHGTARAAWPSYRHVAEAAFREFHALESEVARSSAPTPSLRFSTFLKSGAFTPDVIVPKVGAIDSTSRVAIAAEVSLRLQDDGKVALQHRGEYLDVDWTQMLLLSQLGQGDSIHAAATAVGIDDPEGTLEVIRDWVAEGILQPSSDDARPLGLGPVSRGVPFEHPAAAHSIPEPTVEVDVSSTTSVRLRCTVHLRLTPKGRLWMWLPKQRVHRWFRGLEVAFLCCASRGRTIADAAAEAGLICDGALLSIAQNLLDLGVLARGAST